MGNGPGKESAADLIARIEAPANKFSVGDTVVAVYDLATLDRLQERLGGFYDDMYEILGNVGTVISIDKDGDINAKFTRYIVNTWLLNPEAVTKVHYVRVTDDVTELQRLQVEHGHFNEEMRDILGRIVEVVGVANGKDLRVKWKDNVWTVSPEAVTRASAEEVSTAIWTSDGVMERCHPYALPKVEYIIVDEDGRQVIPPPM